MSALWALRLFAGVRCFGSGAKLIAVGDGKQLPATHPTETWDEDN